MSNNKDLTSRQIQAMKTRKKIFDNAIKLFYEKGYEKTTINDIVNSAGTSKGSFYTYFNSKSDVIVEQFKEIDDHYLEVSKEMKKIDSYQEQLLFFVDKQLKFVINNLNVEIIKILYKNQLEENEAKKTIINSERPLYIIISNIIKNGQKNKEFRTDLEIEELTEMVIRSMRAIFFDWGVADGKFDFVKEGNNYFKNFVIKSLLK